MANWAYTAQAILSPSPLGFSIGLLLLLALPLFLHFFVFRASGLTVLPSFLLIGPSGSGKTTFLTQFERGTVAATRTSQVPLAVECSLPMNTSAASSKYRSVYDPSNQIHKKFLLLDTPGHGKLRYHALDSITNPQNLRGIIFVVDAASMSAGDEVLRQASEFLHDILLILQKRVSSHKISSRLEVPVMIAANKMDLFTALPAALVKSTLEYEIGMVRNSKSRGLLDSGVAMGDMVEAGDKDDWLGEAGSRKFKFLELKEFNILVDVLGGSIIGTDPTDYEKWWDWIGERL